MTKAPSVYKHQKRFWALSGLMSLLVVSYLSLVGLTVSNTLDRQRAESKAASIQTEVSELEFAYVSLTSSMTLEKAKSLGFVEVNDFAVARGDDSFALSR